MITRHQLKILRDAFSDCGPDVAVKLSLRFEDTSKTLTIEWCNFDDAQFAELRACVIPVIDAS